MDEIRSIRATYYSIGVALRLRSSDLKAIRQEHSGDDQQALTETLLLWLNQKYNVAKYGEPTWRMLVEAVDRESGGNDHELAKQIAFNHPQKFDGNVC